jgi:hypothetical protein
MAVWATVGESTHQRLPLEIAIRHLGAPAQPSPRAPGPNAYGDRDYLRGILTDAGFAGVAIEPRKFIVHGGDDAESAAAHAGQMGAVQRLMDEKGADEAVRQTIVKDIAAAFAPYQTAEGLRFPAVFLLVTARRA